MSGEQLEQQGSESRAPQIWKLLLLLPSGFVLAAAGWYVIIPLILAIVVVGTIALVAIFCTPSTGRGARAERIVKAFLRWSDRRDPR